jgi:hypothetical protein
MLTDTAIEKSENQITWENFTAQAKKQKILVYNQGCEKGRFWGLRDKPSISESFSYMYIYDTLVSLDIITATPNKYSFITWRSSYVVTKDKSKLDSKVLENSITNSIKKSIEQNDDVAKLINDCYTINYSELSSLLHLFSFKTPIFYIFME